MTSRGAPSAGVTCPACGVGTPAEARFCPACGQRLGGGVDERRVVTGPWSGDLRVTGPPVHTAARIQQAADPDQILLSARTLRAARDIVEVSPARPLAVGGQGRPVEVAEVLGLSGAEPAPGPMVGREADAAARRARSDATAVGALALASRLAQHEGDGR